MEVFIPKEKFSNFIPEAKKILQDHTDSLLNVTIREISRDSDTALPYATQDMFGLVMLFTIDRRKEAEEILHLKISTLIDLALKYGGTFYLPYRNYANSEQIKKAYPTLENFISTKQQHDPSGTFVNDFYYYLLQSTDQKNVRP